MTDAKALDRSLALVQTLYRRTLEGRIDWRESKQPYAFETESGDFVLRIEAIPDENLPNDPDFALRITDREMDRFVDSISNATLRPFMDRLTPEGQSPYALLKQLYEMARRKALRTDTVIDRVLESLNQQ